jgi:hypothetical protein
MGALTLSPHTIPEQALTRLEGPPNTYEYHDVPWRSRHGVQCPLASHRLPPKGHTERKAR